MRKRYLKQIVAATLSAALILTTAPVMNSGTTVQAEEMISDEPESIGETAWTDSGVSDAEELADIYTDPNGEVAGMLSAEGMPEAAQGYQIEEPAAVSAEGSEEEPTELTEEASEEEPTEATEEASEEEPTELTEEASE